MTMPAGAAINVYGVSEHKKYKKITDKKHKVLLGSEINFYTNEDS